MLVKTLIMTYLLSRYYIAKEDNKWHRLLMNVEDITAKRWLKMLLIKLVMVHVGCSFHLSATQTHICTNKDQC